MIREVDKARLPLAADTNLGFGVHFSPTMLQARWTPDLGWAATTAQPRGSLDLDPAAMVLHYGQAVFEGLKALRHGDRIRIFRPDKHALRLQGSARRLCMPELSSAAFVDAVCRLVVADHDYVPRPPGCLYLRPTIIATEAALGVRPANEYLFFVIGSPSGPYFKDPKRPLRIWVERHYVRAARGGLGSAKASANYAASLLAMRQAKQRGCDQVLWLDSERHREVEELGAGNVFLVWDGKLVTPQIGDSILEGVTRDSLMTIAPEMGVEVGCRPVDVDVMLQAIRDKHITEMFTCGTAAIVTPVGSLLVEDEELQIGDGLQGPTTRSLRERLVGILHGELPDPHGWFVDAWPKAGN